MIKIAFFDMEGTIYKKTGLKADKFISPSAWPLIADHLGPEAAAAQAKTREKWKNGGYANYVEWMAETIMFHQKYGITKELFEKALNTIDFHPGVQEVFKELRKRGIITALISGGFKAQADRAQIDLKIDHAMSGCEYFWDEEGKLVHWNLLPSDYEGKYDFMKLIIKEYRAKPEDCMFVGDGKNDIPLAKAVGVSISFNGAKELEQVCTHVIKQKEGEEDFSKILEYI